MTDLVTEIPSYLKQLARLVARGFYQIEDSLIIDMLVRNTCMKEKDLEDLLKFDLKMLRARMSTLKNEKFVQLRLRMETGLDGKAQKVNYFFINYKSLVNVIKYKLDHMRKRMETQERDATNRASFKCTNCTKTFTDLEAGELFDPETQRFYCTFCKQPVEEDDSAVPKKDSRLMLARFNEQMQMLFDLLRKAEDIKLAPELLEPEPPRSLNDMNDPNSSNKNDRGGIWSGEATRSSGMNDSTRIDIKIGEEANAKPREERKERPIWMTESTIGEYSNSASTVTTRPSAADASTSEKAPREDIMSVLLTYEKKGGTLHKPLIPGGNESESDEEDPDSVSVFSAKHGSNQGVTRMEVDQQVGVMESDDEDQVPSVSVGAERVPINEVNDEVIARMTDSEKETYIQQYQDFFSHMYD